MEKKLSSDPYGVSLFALLSSSHPLFLIYILLTISAGWLWPRAKPKKGGLRLAHLGLILNYPQTIRRKYL